MQGASRDCENIGIGDLYVTIYGGRTRKIGILLGRGLSYEQALNELQGVTLESLVVAKRVSDALKVKSQKGLIDLKDFPMLLHASAVIENGKNAELPWEEFTFCNL